MLAVTMLISVIVVSSVSAVPNIKAESNNALTRIIDNMDLSKLNKIEQKFIDTFGIEKYNETVFKTKRQIYNIAYGVSYSADMETQTINVLNGNVYTQQIESLTRLAVAVILLMLLLLGHNEVGYSTGIAVASAIIFLPCLGIALAGGLPYSLSIIFGLLGSVGIFPSQIIHDYGVFGMFLFLSLIMPLSFTVAVIVYPLAVGLFTMELVNACITEALEIVEDW